MNLISERFIIRKVLESDKKDVKEFELTKPWARVITALEIIM